MKKQGHFLYRDTYVQGSLWIGRRRGDRHGRDDGILFQFDIGLLSLKHFCHGMAEHGLIEEKRTDMSVGYVTNKTAGPHVVHVRYAVAKHVAVVGADDKQRILNVRCGRTGVIVQGCEFIQNETHHILDGIDHDSIGVQRCLPFPQVVIERLIGFILIELFLKEVPRDRACEYTVTERC